RSCYTSHLDNNAFSTFRKFPKKKPMQRSPGYRVHYPEIISATYRVRKPRDFNMHAERHLTIPNSEKVIESGSPFWGFARLVGGGYLQVWSLTGSGSSLRGSSLVPEVGSTGENGR